MTESASNEAVPAPANLARVTGVLRIVYAALPGGRCLFMAVVLLLHEQRLAEPGDLLDVRAVRIRAPLVGRWAMLEGATVVNTVFFLLTGSWLLFVVAHPSGGLIRQRLASAETPIE